MASATVVLYPFPAIGHLVAMVEIGKLIHNHHPSLSIVILVTPAPFETGDTEQYINTVSATVPSITFHHLLTISPPPQYSSFAFIDLAFDIPKLYNPIFHHTLESISKKSTIKAVVLDFFANAAFEVTGKLNIPTYYFYTTGASGLCEFLYHPTIHRTTTKSMRDLNTYLEVPGVPPIHSSDMPAPVLHRESKSYKNFINTAINMTKSSGVIANSFAGLEERAVKALRDGKCVPDGRSPPVYLIGPLIAGGDQSDHECLEWLNTQPSKSVVFLCFGSMGLFMKKQLKEMAIGLEKSGQRFLWVVRNPASYSGENDVGFDRLFPEGFLERSRDKGLVVKNWAPQPAILSHDSVGGFVTHCGWNSALEAVVAGVPMVAWPLYAEQKMNRVFLVEEMKVALAVEMSENGFVTAEALAATVTELMEGEEGTVVRERVLEMSERAKAAVEDGGSSQVEFAELTQSWTAL